MFEPFPVERGNRLVERESADLAQAARAANGAFHGLLARTLHPHALDGGELRVGLQDHLQGWYCLHLFPFMFLPPSIPGVKQIFYPLSSGWRASTPSPLAIGNIGTGNISTLATFSLLAKNFFARGLAPRRPI